MIYDSDGVTVLSRSNPTIEEIQKDVSGRDMSKYGEWNWTVHPMSLGRMSFKQLRYIYSVSSAVRPAVDSIVREVSTLPWSVINRDNMYHPPSQVSDIVDFLERPNLDNEDLSAVLAKFLTDYLVIGKGIHEKVRNANGDILELISRDSALYAPVVNERGFIMEYVEYDRDTYQEVARHDKDDIICKYFTPTTYTWGSVPIIETIINEVSLLMLTIKSIGWAFTRDEIPPGVLHLGVIGQEALDRAKASFEATKGIAAQNKMRVVDNVDTVNWVQFTRTNRDQQVSEIMPMVERIVARNFGLSPVESSLSDVARGVAEMSFASSQSKLIYPIMKVVGNYLTEEVVTEFNKDAKLIWSRVPQENFQVRVDGWSRLVDSGLATDNEARVNLGLNPVQGGDTRSVKLGNERVPLDEKTGLPKYRTPPGGAAPVDAKKPVKKDTEIDDL